MHRVDGKGFFLKEVRWKGGKVLIVTKLSKAPEGSKP